MLHAAPTKGFMPVAFLLSLLGAAFTLWSAWGNAIALCFTAGCTIYQDSSIAGVSIWWLGAIAFSLLGLLAIVGRPVLAFTVSSVALWLDCFLLLLLALTAPCVACLIAGTFFALVYASFRSAAHVKRPLARSWLLMFWALLLLTNLINVARTEMGTWAIQAAASPNTRFYFSPTCAACQDGVRALSGRTDVSFYAVAKNDQDIPLIASMKHAVQQGASMAEALKSALETPALDAVNLYTPDMLLLRFALLRNASYALNAGGGILPLVEHLGLPQENIFRAPRVERKSPPAPRASDAGGLPAELEAPAQCGGTVPCP